LKELCAERSPELASAIDLLFAMEGATDGSGTWNNWESLNFYDVPLVAGIAHLSKLQADIRSAENDVVKWLYRSATTETRVMSNVASAVVPRSTLVMVGDTFAADVFLAAYDEKNRARIDLAGGTDLPLGVDGKGKLRLKADRIGEHTAQGVIHYQGPKGMEEYPYAVTYQVMAPLLVASPMKMNVLYRGVDNPMSFSVPGVTPEHVKPVISNGTIQRKGDTWFAAVNALGAAEVRAMVSMPDGSTRSIGPVTFRVMDLPPPVATFAGAGSTDSRVQLTKLKVAEHVFAKRSDGCVFDERYKVLSFKIGGYLRGNPVEVINVGQELNAASKEFIAALRG
ncbi:MAG: hypothetical protein JNM91_00950, partial [Flavobacteriales bacterium]|nr:hypothetical protein [Flavobacteriales bacterium]